MTKAATVNGASLVYQEQGTGLPVVFVHGGFSDHRIWETQRAATASRHRFIAPSLRYFGSDPWPDKGETFSQETHIADIAAFLRELHAGPVVLVGRSYGAYVAIHVALRHPELVRGLLVNEPNITSLLVTPEQRAVLAADALEFAPVQEAVRSGDLESATRLFSDWTNASPGGFDALPAYVQRVHLDNARTVPLQITAAHNIALSCAELGRLKMPVSIVKGELGRKYLKAIAETMHHCVPGSDLTTIAGAAHGAPSQQPEAFNRLMLAFLSRY